ncbi:hypothetical protein Ait01nite_012760 [Actinoplanes italicus]|uniref:DUF4386 family protein n=1 Tax=Actinoplanes italicus TaxID=113567 RepID=A0A2T0KGZ7_9ACTN|nr:hypothetical protein [Actinoplanes italicus]PRX22709.1 hypothetical protein CLV67_104237 [Actinoplanes italicus]GIE28231.1 hypothetical protein Ait01nite_012760 [Actinoplanes italicus]
MRRFPIARFLLSTHLPFLVMVLAGSYLLVAVILGVAVLVSGPASVSAVDVAGQVLHWLAVGYGYGAPALLATVVVHGRTRREFVAQHPVYQLVAAVVLAALITGVYAAEAALYSAAGWTQAMQPDRPFAAGDYPMIFLANVSMLSIALVTGSFAGVAVYRRDGAGALALVPAAGLLVYGGAVHGFFSLPFAQQGLPMAVTLPAVAAGWVLLWACAREVPLGNRVPA